MGNEELLALALGGINPKKKKAKASKASTASRPARRSSGGRFSKRSSRRAARRGARSGSQGFSLRSLMTIDHAVDLGFVAAGVIAADPGVRFVNRMISEKDANGALIPEKQKIAPLSTMDLAATGGAAIGGALLVKKFTGSDRRAIAALHGGEAVFIQKLLASGKEPLGNKLPVTPKDDTPYGTRLAMMFGDTGAAPDVIFMPGDGEFFQDSPAAPTESNSGSQFWR